MRKSLKWLLYGAGSIAALIVAGALYLNNRISPIYPIGEIDINRDSKKETIDLVRKGDIFRLAAFDSRKVRATTNYGKVYYTTRGMPIAISREMKPMVIGETTHTEFKLENEGGKVNLEILSWDQYSSSNKFSQIEENVFGK